METMSADELSKLDIEGIEVAEPFGTLLGEPEKNAVYFIWGAKGAGKSTLSLALADALANHGRVEYIPAEEHFGKTLVDRVKRLDATHDNLHFTKYSSLPELKEDIKRVNAQFIVLDSITVIDGDDKATVEFAQWCRDSGIGFIMVAHATKDGQYKGNTSIAHECDIELQVTVDGEAVAEKNRYKQLTSVQVPFTAEQREILRDNPAPGEGPSPGQGGKDEKVHGLATIRVEDITEEADLNESGTMIDPKALPKIRKKYGTSIYTEIDGIIGDALSDEVYDFETDQHGQPFDTFTIDGELWEGQEYEITLETKRDNPVEVPFSMTLDEINKLHKFRSWKRLNSMLGSKMPCYAKKHSGESETAHLSLRYTPDYRNKKYILELLMDGHLEAQFCTEGASGSFKKSLKQLMNEYGDLEVVIYAQDHAKKVLGAKEYKRQEREYAKSQKKEKKTDSDSKKPKTKEKETAVTTSESSEDHLQKGIPGKPNVSFRMLYDFPTGKDLMGITWAKHDGTIEGIQKAAKKAQDHAYELFGGQYTNAGSPIYATDENGEVAHAISPNFSTVAEVTTKRAFEMYGLGLEKVGVDVSQLAKEANEKIKKEAKKESSKKASKSKGSKSKKKKESSAGKEDIDVEAVRESQNKLDEFLSKMLS